MNNKTAPVAKPVTKPVVTGLVVLLMTLATSLAWSQDSILMIDNPARLPDLKPDARKQYSLTAAAFIANDMVPVTQFEDDPWPQTYRTRGGDNLGMGNLRLELSASDRGWTAGYFHREDWRLRGNRDTVDAYALGKREQLSGLNRNFDLDYEISGFSADGLKIGYSWSRIVESGRGLVVGISTSLMRGGAVRVESAKGTLISLSNSATLNGNRSLSYSGLNVVPGAQADGFNDFTPAMPQSSDSGFGYGLDIGASYVFDNGGMVSFAINDLFGKVKWDRVAHIEQNISGLSDPFEFSGNGGATFTKTSSYKSISLNLDPKYMLEGTLPLRENLNLKARIEHSENSWFPQIGMRYAIGTDWQLGLDYETRFKSSSFSLQGKRLSLALTSKSLKLDESTVLGFSAGLRMPF